MKTLHTAYRVQDLDRSVDFYEKVGFREIGQVVIADGSTSSEAKRELAANVTHELRTPLASIRARIVVTAHEWNDPRVYSDHGLET